MKSYTGYNNILTMFILVYINVDALHVMYKDGDWGNPAERTCDKNLMRLCQRGYGQFWLLACPVRMLRILIIWDWKLMGNQLTHIYLQNGH